MKTKSKKAKAKPYRVWIEQVNQTYLDVSASSEQDARDKAYRKWRRHYAHAYVSDAREL